MFSLSSKSRVMLLRVVHKYYCVTTTTYVPSRDHVFRLLMWLSGVEMAMKGVFVFVFKQKRGMVAIYLIQRILVVHAKLFFIKMLFLNLVSKDVWHLSVQIGICIELYNWVKRPLFILISLCAHSLICTNVLANTRSLCNRFAKLCVNPALMAMQL